MRPSFPKKSLLDIAEERGNQPGAVEQARAVVRGLLDFAPGVGDLLAAKDAYQSWKDDAPLWQTGLLGLGALPGIPAIAGPIMHRGIRGAYKKDFDQPVEWWAKEKSLAERYGDNVMEADIKPAAPADLGFRDFNTEVKASDVSDRLKRIVLDAFRVGSIPQAQAKRLFDRADAFSGDGYKRVHEWVSGSPEVAEILKAAGFDSIEHVESGVQTFGMLK